MGQTCRCIYCGKNLGEIEENKILIKYRRRTILAFLPAKIQCEDCKTVNFFRKEKNSNASCGT